MHSLIAFIVVIKAILTHWSPIFRGSKVFGQSKVLVLEGKSFAVHVWRPLTLPNADFPPIRCFQVFTAASYSCCLFVSLSAFSFVINEWNRSLVGLRIGHWFHHYKIFYFFVLRNKKKTLRSLLQNVLGHYLSDWISSRPFVC